MGAQHGEGVGQTGLVDKMLHMLALTPAERAVIGQRGRDKMVREFDEGIVIRRYLDEVAAVFDTQGKPIFALLWSMRALHQDAHHSYSTASTWREHHRAEQ